MISREHADRRLESDGRHVHELPLLSPEATLEISSNQSKARLSPDYDIYGPVLDQSYTTIHLEKVEDNWYLTGEIEYVLD